MASLSWVKAADEILRAGGLTPHENDFVRGLRGKMDWSAKPGRRKRYVLSEKQQAWFVRIYRRVVQVGKEKADVSE
jgi:hypothetical protein